MKDVQSATDAPIRRANKSPVDQEDGNFGSGSIRASSASRSVQEHASSFSNAQRKIAVLVVALAFVMDLLDGTIVNIAIPSIQEHLHANAAAIQWLVAGYALTFAVLLITGGRMGDVFGYRRIFLIGVAGFLVSSLVCGLAPTPGILVTGRLAQGAMAALMVPQVLAMVQLLYRPEERVAINGVFGGLAALAGAAGPVIGGLLIRLNIAGLDWRLIFLINAPVALFAIVMGLRHLPYGSSDHPLQLDLRGTVLIVAAMALVLFPLIQGRELGWPAWAFVMLVAAVPVFAIFFREQRRKGRVDASPLINLGLCRHRSFSAGLAVLGLTVAAMACFSFTFTMLLQIGRGYSPIHAALTGIFIPIGVIGTVGALGKTVIPRLGRRAPAIGFFVLGVGVSIAALVVREAGPGLSTWHLAPVLLLMGIGMALVFGSVWGFALSEVDPQEAGSASGVMNAVQQLGGAIGVALVGVVFFNQLHVSASYAAAFQAGVFLEVALLVVGVAITFYLPHKMVATAQPGIATPDSLAPEPEAAA